MSSVVWSQDPIGEALELAAKAEARAAYWKAQWEEGRCSGDREHRRIASYWHDSADEARRWFKIALEREARIL